MATKENTSNTKEYPDKFGRKHDSQEKADAANAQIDAQRKYLKTKYNDVEEDVALEVINILNPDLCIDIEGLTEDEFAAALGKAQVTRSLEIKKKEDEENSLENSLKDKAGLSEKGLPMWVALRLVHQLEWYEDYCWPKEGDREQKAHALRDILFELMTPITAYVLTMKIEEVIENFEPRARLVGVRATPNLDNNAYEVTIEFYVVNAPTELVNMEVLLERLR